MLQNTAILVLLCNILRVRGWAPNPGPSCDQCCCCVVVANEGSRNFYAQTGGSSLMNTIPNCYYLQTHLSDVLANWEGGEVEDGNTSPGQYLYWLPTDPAYGCYNDLATVTATNFNDGPSASVGPPSGNGGSSTTSPQSEYLSLMFLTVATPPWQPLLRHCQKQPLQQSLALSVPRQCQQQPLQQPSPRQPQVRVMPSCWRSAPRGVARVSALSVTS